MVATGDAGSGRLAFGRKRLFVGRDDYRFGLLHSACRRWHDADELAWFGKDRFDRVGCDHRRSSDPDGHVPDAKSTQVTATEALYAAFGLRGSSDGDLISYSHHLVQWIRALPLSASG